MATQDHAEEQQHRMAIHAHTAARQAGAPILHLNIVTMATGFLNNRFAFRMHAPEQHLLMAMSIIVLTCLMVAHVLFNVMVVMS